jgi:hypothetical protein
MENWRLPGKLATAWQTENVALTAPSTHFHLHGPIYISPFTWSQQ